MHRKTNIYIRRVYDPPGPGDGYRVLVDRLWPRGIKKERLAFDQWLKDIAPSATLRTWFGHRPERFPLFAKKYKKELATNPALDELKQLVKKHRTITLLIAAKDPDHHHALVIRELL